MEVNSTRYLTFFLLWVWMKVKCKQGKQRINRKPERKRKRGGERKKERDRERKKESEESLPVWPDPWGIREGDTEDGEKVGKRTRQVRVHRESRSHPTRDNSEGMKGETNTIQRHCLKLVQIQQASASEDIKLIPWDICSNTSNHMCTPNIYRTIKFRKKN